MVGSETLTPRNQLGSTAFAMNADKLDGLDSIDLIQNQTASAQAASFRINGSGTAATLSATTTINLGTASSSTGTMVLNNSGNANTVTLRAGTTATSYTLTLPTADGNTGDCLKDSNGSGVLAFSSCASGDSISVNGTAATDANFLDTAATGTSTGVTFTLSTAANPDTIAVTIGNASATVAGAVTTGTQTFAGAKTFNDSITLAAAKTLNLTGGTTANRPASPTEGMIYYDTTTKQLLTYANGKWQAESRESVKIVAASNSSQAIKDSADYVADGTADEVEINAAITAAPAVGCKIFLHEGTYNLSAAANFNRLNCTLQGASQQTILKRFYNEASQAGLVNLANTNTKLMSLSIDGNKATYTSGNNQGIRVTSGTAQKVIDSWVYNSAGHGFDTVGYTGDNLEIRGSKFYGSGQRGINTDNPYGAVISNNDVYSNGTDGIWIGNSATNVRITDNLVHHNGNYGIKGTTDVINNRVYSNVSWGISIGSNIKNNRVTSNGSGINYMEGAYVDSNYVASNSGDGILFDTGTGATVTSTVSNNQVMNNGQSGIKLGNIASMNLITGNTIVNNGGSSSYHGIDVNSYSGGYGNKVMNNLITDSAGTGYAISISAGNSGVHLSDNTFYGTGASSISDSGTGTTYSNQPLSANGGNITNRTANSTAAFQIQNASSVSILTVDTTNAHIHVGPVAGDTVGTLLVLGNKTNAGDPTGVEGAMYYNNSTKDFRCYQNGGWRNCVSASHEVLDIEDEFMTGLYDGEVEDTDYVRHAGELGWLCDSDTYNPGVNSTTGCHVNQSDEDANHPGIMQLDTTNNGTIGWSASMQLRPITLSSFDRLTFIVKTETDYTDSEAVVGLVDDRTNLSWPDGGIYFQYDGSYNEWRAVSRASNVETNQSTGVSLAGSTWYRLEIRKIGSTYYYYINGSQVATSTTNIPTAAQTPYVGVWNRNSVDQGTIRIDYFSMRSATLSR